MYLPHQHNPILIVRLKGGLGNQLFQYALGRHLSVMNDAKLLLDTSFYKNTDMPDARSGERIESLHHFNVRAEYIELENWLSSNKSKLPDLANEVIRRIEKRLPYHWGRYVIEPEVNHFKFDPKVYGKRIKQPVILDGYWQTEKYFADIVDVIRSEITLKDKLTGKNEQMARLIESTNSVGVHVRHGDNVNTAHGVLPQEYYLHAIQKINREVNEPHLFVFSDDMPYAKTLFDLPFPITYVNHNGDEKNYLDLILMSLCKHNILANSTFSWWGAWLRHNNHKIVYAPHRYYQKADRENPDYYPKEWRTL